MRKRSRVLWIHGLCWFGLAACSGDEESSKSSKSEDDDATKSSEADGGAEESAATGTEDVSVDEGGGVSTGGTGTGAGVSLLKPTTAGLCRLESPDASKNSCWDYQPRDVDSLAPGTYVLHARLSVERDLEVPATFDTHCRRSGTDRDLKHRPQTTDVSRGSAEEGFRLRYLTLTVPDTDWASDCTWSLSVPDEYGGELASGSWYFTLP